MYVQVRGEYGLEQDLPLMLLALLALLSSTHPCFSLLLTGHVDVKICGMTYSPRCTHLITGAAMPKSLFMGFMAN